MRQKRSGGYSKKQRMALGFVGVFFLFLGSVTLYENRLSYSNYWGGSVFTPFAVVFGLLFVSAAFLARKET
jgi:hypothetical protein